MIDLSKKCTRREHHNLQHRLFAIINGNNFFCRFGSVEKKTNRLKFFLEIFFVKKNVSV